jgi:hypothetical protein
MPQQFVEVVGLGRGQLAHGEVDVRAEPTASWPRAWAMWGVPTPTVIRRSKIFLWLLPRSGCCRDDCNGPERGAVSRPSGGLLLGAVLAPSVTG